MYICLCVHNMFGSRRLRLSGYHPSIWCFRPRRTEACPSRAVDETSSPASHSPPRGDSHVLCAFGNYQDISYRFQLRHHPTLVYRFHMLLFDRFRLSQETVVYCFPLSLCIVSLLPQHHLSLNKQSSRSGRFRDELRSVFINFKSQISNWASQILKANMLLMCPYCLKS